MLDFIIAIPLLIAVSTMGLLGLFVWFLQRTLSECRRALRRCGRFTQLIRSQPPSGILARRQGLELADVERLRAAMGREPGLEDWWSRLDGALEPYTPPDGSEGWFLTHPVEELLPEAIVIDRDYHASFHQAVPGLLTGLGLTATFIAILVALQGVTVQIKGGSETVHGIGMLINGLAGKFLSSIVALLLSVWFTLVERKWCERRLQNAYHALVSAAREILPVLSPARVLLDLHTQSARRTALIQSLSGDIAERIVWAIRGELAGSAEATSEIRRFSQGEK